MGNYFCLSVTFLAPEYHGRGDAGIPEWPPSPLRLFQAIVAAVHLRGREGGVPDDVIAALRWLEKQEPPEIVAPRVEVGQPYRLSVPNNAMDIVARHWAKGNDVPEADAPAKHRTLKTVRPICLKGGESVHYLWKLEEVAGTDTLDLVEALSVVARQIVAVGWGIDLVAGAGRVLCSEKARQLAGERWQGMGASRNGAKLRAPVQSTLQALIGRHQAFLGRVSGNDFAPVPPLPGSAFAEVGYRRDTDLSPRPFAAFSLLNPETGSFRSFPATRAVSVAGMIRHAAGDAARPSGRPEEWINQFVLGHRPPGSGTLPRFSYIPLPTIDPRMVVSGIRRVLITEAHGADGEHAVWIKRALQGQLVTNNEKQPVAYLVPFETDGVLNRYVDHAYTWATATPVALPGCDDGKEKKTERLFMKALRHAGYSPDAVAEVEFRRTPFFRGAEYSLNYRPRPPHYLHGCSVYYVRVRWRRPLSGPLAIGSGRHCGLGVFAA